MMLSAVLATASSTKSGSTCTAVVNGITTTVEVARDLTVAVGDVLVLMRFGSQWFAVSRHYSSSTTIPTNEPPPPPPKPSIVTGTLVVAPVETRSYRTSFGWRTDNTSVYQGEYGGWGNHTGAVFYGGKPRSLSGATVTDAKIRVRRLTGGAYAARGTTMRLMTNATRPAGPPTLSSSTDGPSLAVGATSNGFDVPNSWVQAMVDGTAGGLAFFESDGSPYVRFAGKGDWASAFTMTIKWQRST